jgi:hypothetical protein
MPVGWEGEVETPPLDQNTSGMTITSITKIIITVGPLRPTSIFDLQLLLTITITTTTTITTPDQIHITTVTTASSTVHNPALKETNGKNPRL